MTRRNRDTGTERGVWSLGRVVLASAAAGVAVFANLAFFGFALDLLPDPAPYLLTAAVWGGAAGVAAVRLGWRLPWVIALGVGFGPGVGPGIFAFTAVLLWPDRKARVDAHLRLLSYLRLEAELRALQNAEASRYLDTIVSDSDDQAGAQDALDKAKRAARRLESVSQDILERRQQFGEPPHNLTSLCRASQDCDEVFVSWARAESSRMAAAADGVSLARDPAGALYAQWEKARNGALAEQERALSRLHLSPGERASLVAGSAAYAPAVDETARGS